MGLSPDSVAKGVEYKKVACFLSGDDHERVKAKESEHHSYNETEFFRWQNNIINAIKNGELETFGMMAYGLKTTSCSHPDWFCIELSDLVKGSFEPDQLRIGLERHEVARWLKSCGIPDDEIPEALRIQTDREEDVPSSSVKSDGTNKKKFGRTKIIEVRKDVITEDLLEKGYGDPANLPEVRGKRGGVKEVMRNKLIWLRPDLFTKKTFNEAWGELRRDGRIIGGE